MVYVILITADNVVARMPMPGFRFAYEIRRPVMRIRVAGAALPDAAKKPEVRTYAFEDVNEGATFIEYIYQERV
jgi:hypothetical protein